MFNLQRYDAVLPDLETAWQAMPDRSNAMALLAACDAALGRLEEARAKGGGGPVPPQSAENPPWIRVKALWQAQSKQDPAGSGLYGHHDLAGSLKRW